MTQTPKFKPFAVLNEGTHIIYHRGRRLLSTATAAALKASKAYSDAERLARLLTFPPLTSYRIYSSSKHSNRVAKKGVMHRYWIAHQRLQAKQSSQKACFQIWFFLKLFFGRCHEQVSL